MTAVDPRRQRLSSTETDPRGWEQNPRRPRSARVARQELSGATEPGVHGQDQIPLFLSLVRSLHGKGRSRPSASQRQSLPEAALTTDGSVPEAPTEYGCNERDLLQSSCREQRHPPAGGVRRSDPRSRSQSKGLRAAKAFPAVLYRASGSGLLP